MVTVMTEAVSLLQVSKVEGNANMKMGGGSDGVARGREDGSWDDED